MMTDQHPPSEDSPSGSVVYDYERAYGCRIPSSYDAEAAASLLLATAEDSTLLDDDDVELMRRVIRAWAGQFRTSATPAAATGREGE